MDLSKAFDCLPHGLFIAKLHAYGLSIKACDLFSSYLCNKFQRVKVNNCRTEWAVIRQGISQGSILGPLLFNVFVNNMFHFMEKCDLYNYADDNSLSVASYHMHDVLSYLSRDCKNAVKWFRDNGMQANPSKFQFMILSHSGVDASNANQQIDDNIALKPEPRVKVLGIMLDSKLNFNHHVSAKAAWKLNALARISRFLSTSSRMIIYNSFINSNVNYCPIVWHFCGKMNGDKIEKIQERALRMIYRNYDSLYSELLRDAGAYTMLDKRLHSMLLHVFKSLKGMNAKCLNDMYSVKQNNAVLHWLGANLDSAMCNDSGMGIINVGICFCMVMITPSYPIFTQVINCPACAAYAYGNIVKWRVSMIKMSFNSQIWITNTIVHNKCVNK